ncbi:YggT family protein [uncultured Ilyobacter sp.]|uniref:YggT family protein n=1 Tax=uncultured Ilyobacter sp. TaxID=544433 RepID=UPI0029F47E4D|nr:YggT family protein [uncultured Ilyobacter sp.]
MLSILKIIDLAIRALKMLILIRIVISWVAPYSRNEFTHLVYQVTEPILRPFRMLIPLGSMRMDLSPILAYFALNLIRSLAFGLLLR